LDYLWNAKGMAAKISPGFFFLSEITTAECFVVTLKVRRYYILQASFPSF
jgi:hypothetical protein